MTWSDSEIESGLKDFTKTKTCLLHGSSNHISFPWKTRAERTHNVKRRPLPFFSVYCEIKHSALLNCLTDHGTDVLYNNRQSITSPPFRYPLIKSFMGQYSCVEKACRSSGHSGIGRGKILQSHPMQRSTKMNSAESNQVDWMSLRSYQDDRNDETMFPLSPNNLVVTPPPSSLKPSHTLPSRLHQPLYANNPALLGMSSISPL